MSESWEKAEGPWAHFQFRRVEEKDHASLFAQLRENFMKDEPTCQLLGYTNDFGDETELLIKNMLGDGWSLLVEHQDTKELVGFLIVFKRTKKTVLDFFTASSYAGQVVLRLLDILSKMGNLLDAYGVDQMGELFLLSVAPKWRKAGVATELYRRSLAFLQSEGVKLAGGTFTCPSTRTIGKRLGFQEVCRLEYKEFIDEMGQSVFNPEELLEEHFAAVMAKKLQ